jgi:hypothetical protein
MGLIIFISIVFVGLVTPALILYLKERRHETL